jgi:phytoene desaturase
VARVVVVGAGFSGLTTAIWLADFGHDVVVYEQLDRVGGRLRALGPEDDPVELSPDLVTLPAVLRDLFRKTGRPLDKVVDLTLADPAFRYYFPDGTMLELPNTSRAGITRALDSAFGDGAGEAWQDVVGYGGKVWAAVRPALLTATPTSRRRGEIRLPRQLHRALGLDETLRSLGRQRLREPLRAMLEHRAAGVDPRTAPAGLAVIAYVQQTFGRWRIAGGMSRLVAALHDRALERGATVTTGTTVTDVHITRGRAIGVRLATGRELSADIVISAVDASHLAADLLPQRAWRRPNTAPSPGLFSLALTVDPPLALPAHTVLLSPRPDDALDAVHRIATLPEHPTIDIYTRPDGAALTVTVLVPPHGDESAGALDWTAPGKAADFAERVRTLIAGHGIDPTVTSQTVRTPADTTRETNAAGGGAFGPAATNARDMLARNNRTNVRGLFLVGSSAYPGPGLPLAGLSAAMVADLIGRA